MENVKDCGFNGMMENCGAESAQGGFTNKDKSINVLHEGDPRKTNKSGDQSANSFAKTLFGEQKKDVKVRKMNGKTGQVDELVFFKVTVLLHVCLF